MNGEKRMEGREDDDPNVLGLAFNDELYSPAEVEAEILAAAEADERLSTLPHFRRSNLQHVSTQLVKHHLEAAQRALTAADTGPNLANSPALSIPVLGKLWGMIRGQMHQLVLFYVNRAGRTHSQVNGQLVEAVKVLTQLVEAQQAEIKALKNEIDHHNQQEDKV